MPQPQLLNLQPTESQPAGDDVWRLKRQMERQEDEHQEHQRRTRILSVILGSLIVSLVGIVWAIYPTIRDEKKGLAELFSLQNVTNTLTERIGSVEGTVNKMKSDLPALSDRIDKAQANMKTNLQVARNQMNRSIQAIQARLSGLESNQKESSERVNRLQEQVSGLQREIQAMREEKSKQEEPPAAAEPQD